MYDRKEAQANETVYCQVKLEEPVISSRKERFIIRRPSPATTIAGGTVIEPNASKHKYRTETIDLLKQRSKGTLEDLILQQLLHNKQYFLTTMELSNQLTLPEKEIEGAIIKLKEQDKIIAFENGKPYIYCSPFHLNNLKQQITNYLEEYHQSYPLRNGAPKAEFLGIYIPNLKPKLAQYILLYLEDQKLIKTNEDYVSAYNFTPQLPEALQNVAAQMEKVLLEQQFSPDDWDEIANRFSLSVKDKQELYNYLLNQNKIIKLTDKVVLHYQTYTHAKQLIIDHLNNEKQLTLQQAKDILQVSRKYLIPIMETLDREQVTVLRQGQNYRELRQSN